MAERVYVRELVPGEGNKLLGIIRRGSGSVVRWRRAQIVLWSAQAMDVPAIAEIAFTSEDRVREVIHNFNSDGFDSLAPKYAGGRPPKVTLPERHEIKNIALSRSGDHGLPFSTWSLSKLAEFLVAEGVVDDISHEGLRVLLREEGVSFQVIKLPVTEIAELLSLTPNAVSVRLTKARKRLAKALSGSSQPGTGTGPVEPTTRKEGHTHG